MLKCKRIDKKNLKILFFQSGNQVHAIKIDFGDEIQFSLDDVKLFNQVKVSFIL